MGQSIISNAMNSKVGEKLKFRNNWRGIGRPHQVIFHNAKIEPKSNKLKSANYFLEFYISTEPL